MKLLSFFSNLFPLRKRFVWTVLVVALSVLLSCDRWIGTHFCLYDTNSAICQYQKFSGLHISGTLDLTKEDEDRYIYVLARYLGEDMCSMFSTGDSLALYKSLCDRYGDYGYAKTGIQVVTIGEGEKGLFASHYAWGEQIVGFSVTCDTDYDDSHPAGSSLNDCFDIEVCDIKDFIAGGYERIDRIRKPLSEITAEDLDLAFADGVWRDAEGICRNSTRAALLHFTQFPSSHGSYTLNISAKIETGEVYTYPVVVTY